jgi:alpha-L-fucosidase
MPPTPAQQSWMNLGFGLFVHFSINTFNDVEWSYGNLDVASFDPPQIDTDQWCHAAAEAGMKFLVLVTKHQDGFCNWPTATTSYSVKSSPWKKDVVAQVARSCEKFGLKLGLYFSLQDSSDPRLLDPHYDHYCFDFNRRQLTELLTGYGPVCELWFDAFWKKQKTGWQGDHHDIMRAWRDEGAPRWRWDALYAHVKSLQPDCIVINNSTTKHPGVPLWPVDARPGEKATQAHADASYLGDSDSARSASAAPVVHPPSQKIWRWNDADHYLPMQMETTLSQKGPDPFPEGSWFWHEWDHTVASKQQILGWLDDARRSESVLLLNAGPSRFGKLREEDFLALTTLRK